MQKPDKSGLNIRAWVRDRIIFLAVVIFVAGAGAYIGAEGLFDHESIWLHPVKEFALLISLIGVVSLGYELFLREMTFREYKDALQEIVNPDAVRLGIKGFYKNRSELGQASTFEQLFKKVNREIFIGGSSLLSISTASRELLKEKVRAGVTVRLLLMNPDSPVVELITKQGGGKATFLNEIKTSLLLLQKIYHEIEGEGGLLAAGKLIVHTYDIIPSHSFISLDPGDRGGMIIADIGPYLGRSTPRPSMVVINKKEGMYEYWQEMNALMWEASQPVDFKEASPRARPTETLVFNSGKDTEYYDTNTESWRNASICQMDKGWKGIKGSQWVWVRATLTLHEAKTGSQNKFRLRFQLPAGKRQPVVRADLLLRSDDTCHITVNDVGLKQEYGGADYPDPFVVDIGKFVKEGDNTVFFELLSFAKPDAESPGDNRTGLIYRLHIEYPL
ncbi:MAG: hypothetical protein JSU88_10505 [Nitrospinaceae bacterium]|jgi:hypothetical protein|nr:MAG: hypothetical protein JSU88_10505 [Nitrospinaceae bacterium]